MNIIDELKLIDRNNIDIPNFENLDWFKIVRRNNSPLFSSLIRMGLLRQHPDFEFQNTIKSQAILNNDIYAVNEEVANLSKNIIDLAEKDGDFLDRYYKLVRKDHKNFIDFAKK